MDNLQKQPSKGILKDSAKITDKTDRKVSPSTTKAVNAKIDNIRKTFLPSAKKKNQVVTHKSHDHYCDSEINGSDPIPRLSEKQLPGETGKIPASVSFSESETDDEGNEDKQKQKNYKQKKYREEFLKLQHYADKIAQQLMDEEDKESDKIVRRIADNVDKDNKDKTVVEHNKDNKHKHPKTEREGTASLQLRKGSKRSA